MISDLHGFRALAAAVVAAFALAACAGASGQADGPAAQATDVASAPEPGLTSEAVRGNGCQAPALPPPPSGSQVLDDDCISVTVVAGEALWLHGDQVLEQQHIPVPSCPGFGSSFSWQVTSPGQPSVSLFIAPQGDPQPGVSGASGTIDGYCGTVAAEHVETVAVTMDLRYRLVDLCPGC